MTARAGAVCALEQALGRSTPCPENACALWDDGRCVVAGVRADVAVNSDLAEILLGLRAKLDAVRNALPERPS